MRVPPQPLEQFPGAWEFDPRSRVSYYYKMHATIEVLLSVGNGSECRGSLTLNCQKQSIFFARFSLRTYEGHEFFHPE